MTEQEMMMHITALQARMNRTERLMQQLLQNMTSSHSHMDQVTQMQNMLHELRNGPDNHLAPHPTPVAPQERPEFAAIRQALFSGNKLKAIQLYRNLYGVSAKEAQDALDAM